MTLLRTVCFAMANVFDRSQSIRRFIVKSVVDHPADIAAVAADEFGLTRQSINRHLRKLVDHGVLVSTGNTKSREYRLRAGPGSITELELTVDEALQEDDVWRTYIRPQLEGVSGNVLRICQYGFTEMLNNVKDHSESTSVLIGVAWKGDEISLLVADQGVGIFKKVQSALGLSDPRQAILELSKGKLTTSEFTHTGEGIFFTSKMFDRFLVGSDGIAYLHGYEQQGFVSDSDFNEGTGVVLTIRRDAKQTMNEIFDEYAAGSDDYSFNKTLLAVKLAKYDQEDLVSRSQAKRVLARMEQFHEVVVDFSGVEFIGPSFADELFRVFTNEHPEVRLVPIGMTSDVKRAMTRATRN